MLKLSEKYLHEETKITFEVEFEQVNRPDFSDPIIRKKIQVRRADGDKEFIFGNSKAETLIKIGKAMQEIGEFCEKL